MLQNKYCYAKLSKHDIYLFRMIGSGLGNILFPWARCVVAGKRYGLKIINPTWLNIKPGAILRNENDKRFYNDLFDSHKIYISGLKKLLLLLVLKKSDENSCADYKVGEIAIFSGMDGFFQNILNDHEIVYKELKLVTKLKHLNKVDQFKADGISVHVRLGDFSTPNSDQVLLKGRENYRLPLQWYVEQVQTIRDQLRKNVPVYIFSDGNEKELQPLLELPNTKRYCTGSSIGDLLALAKSSALVASGSTFSMWASYLGRMPVVWYKGQLRQRLYTKYPEFEVEHLSNEKFETPFLNEFTKLSGKV